MSKKLNQPLKGRGAVSNPDNRFHSQSHEDVHDGWGDSAEALPRLNTELIRDDSKSLLTYNQSPDVPFDRSINPYRGCEHGCIYCFARPSHAFLDFSPGLDFETKLLFKPDAAAILRRELAAKRYRCAPIGLGVNTDAYQPVERRLGITRGVLEVLLESRHPVSIITKSALIERDIDLLSEMAKNELISVIVSITTLDTELARKLEPRAASPQRRLKALAALACNEIPVSVLFAPVIPSLNDHEMEAILTRCADLGAQSARYIFLRLPYETRELFQEWLQQHYPLKAEHILNRVRDSRGGREYEAKFGSRMRGEGVYADLIEQRFKLACKRLNLIGSNELRCDLFQAPAIPTAQPQLELFD